MSPNLRTAEKQLGYPLYGADFDPSNSDFLLVGGGGGSTSSGVPNKISLLDTSRADKLNEVVDINLAKDEDSVTSLAVAESDETSLIAYAGINGSIKDQEAGKNEHFRSFRIGLPAKRKADGTDTSSSNTSGAVRTTPLARSALFKSAMGPKNDTYQRVLRVDPARKDGGERLAAIASGLATKSEVLVFRATPSPSPSNVISRIDLEQGEAVGIDLYPVEDEAQTHVLTFCTDYDVFLQHIPSTSGKGVQEPIKTFSTSSDGQRTKIRSIRWLNSRYLVLLCNRPAGGGAELVVLKTDKDYTQAQHILTKILAKSTKQAVGLAIAALSPMPKGDQQFLVAIAGQDSSVEILSIDFYPGAGMSKFRRYAHLRGVHSGPITCIAFSNFIAPPLPVSKDTKPQYIRLASVGVGQKVVVHTLPLRPYPAIYTKEPRYVLTPPPETLQSAYNISMAFLVVAIVAFFMQVFCEIRGVVPPTLHAQSWLSPSWHQRIAVPYRNPHATIHAMPGPIIADSIPPVISDTVSATAETVSQAAEAGATLLQDLVAEQESNPNLKHSRIVMRDTSNADDSNNNPDDHDHSLPAGTIAGSSIEAEMYDKNSEALKNDDTIKKWDQLSEKEKKGWKKRLIDAGHWTEKQGESVLKGILFSELGAAVGAAVRGG